MPQRTYFLHPQSIRNLFDNIAPTYDLLNHLLSAGTDIRWRKAAVRELAGLEGWILDLATGTGDVAIEIALQENGIRRVLGLDFSEPMIRGAQQKLLRRGLSDSISLSLGDAVSLPFRDSAFSACTIAFGLRNVLKKEEALAEMVRVVKEGGKVIVLEFTFPRRGIIRRLYPLYFRRILPAVGGLISGDRGAYAYLPESVLQFKRAEDYVEMMRRTGLRDIGFRQLTCGIASIIAGRKGQR